MPAGQRGTTWRWKGEGDGGGVRRRTLVSDGLIRRAGAVFRQPSLAANSGTVTGPRSGLYHGVARATRDCGVSREDLVSMTPWLQRLDARDRAMLTRLCLSPSCGSGTRVFWSFITHLGGARASIGLSLLALLIPEVRVPHVWSTLLLLGWSHLAVQVVKRTVGRPRPQLTSGLESLIEVPDRFSFPSGHSCAAMAVAIGFSTAFPALAVPLLIVALLVGFSRVMLGVHYPGDVVVGQVIALLAAYPLLT